MVFKRGVKFGILHYRVFNSLHFCNKRYCCEITKIDNQEMLGKMQNFAPFNNTA